MGNKPTIQLISFEGERWCDLAHRAYGKGTMMNEIIKANPSIPVYDRLPGGLNINVPIIEKVEVKTNAELLPPWKSKR